MSNLKMLGTIISLSLIVAGLALQILVPLHIIDFSTMHFLRLPSEIGGVFLGTALILIGTWGHYFFYYKSYADHLDELSGNKKEPHKK